MCLQLQEGVGQPIIITDAFKDWAATEKWSFKFFKERYGHLLVTVNDRAPARHADALETGVGAQRTEILPLREYIQYVEVCT